MPSKRLYRVSVVGPGSPLNVLFEDVRRFKDSVSAAMYALKQVRKHYVKTDVEVNGQSVNVEVELQAEG